MRKIFGCIEFKLELTRAITDKKNAGNVGECIIPSMSKLPSASCFSGLCQTEWVTDLRGGGIVFTCVNTTW